MKTLTFIISLLFVFCIPSFGQDSQTVESFSISAITESFKMLVTSVNWLFVIVFILTAWLVNDTSEATNTVSVSWFTKIPKSIRALIIGLLCVVLFAWVNQTHSREEIFKLIISLLLSMVIYKFGIKKALRFISTRIGLKFE